MSTPTVQATGVHKSFGRTEVLRGVDLTVMPGEVCCVIGPSGSGKSTLLRCINHLERIDAGRMRVDGELIGHREAGGKLHELRESEVARQRREIGMVFQRFNLFPHRTALDPELVGEVLDVMRGLAADGMTMVVVTHEMGFAREVGDALVFMDDGRIVESGAPRAVLADPQHERTRSFLSKVL